MKTYSFVLRSYGPRVNLQSFNDLLNNKCPRASVIIILRARIPRTTASTTTCSGGVCSYNISVSYVLRTVVSRSIDTVYNIRFLFFFFLIINSHERHIIFALITRKISLNTRKTVINRDATKVCAAALYP